MKAVGPVVRAAVQADHAACGDPGYGDATVAVMPLAGPGILVTALANDAVTLRRRLDRAAPPS